jgi:plasmid stabilization system protein ParE
MVTHQLTSQIRIALDKPMAALNWAESIQKSVNKLKEFSQLGREVPKVKKAGIRELLKENYRIIYRTESNCIFILAIKHTKQLLNKELNIS